jgi:hypothetical protein
MTLACITHVPSRAVTFMSKCAGSVLLNGKHRFNKSCYLELQLEHDLVRFYDVTLSWRKPSLVQLTLPLLSIPLSSNPIAGCRCAHTSRR